MDCGLLAYYGYSKTTPRTELDPLRMRSENSLMLPKWGLLRTGCPVPIFSLFFEPIPIFSYFKTKTSYFSYFLACEAKICNKMENGIIAVCFLSEIYHKASIILTLMF